MKAQVKRRALLDVLGQVKYAVPGKATLPILSYFLVIGSKGKLTMAANNLDVIMVGSCDANVDGAGKVAVPAKPFEDFLKAVKVETVALQTKTKVKKWMEPTRAYNPDTEQFDDTGEQERSSKTVTIVVTAGNAKTTLSCAAPKDFPDIPIITGSKITADLVPGLKKVIYAASKDDCRPVLNGVCLTQDKGYLELVAADGFRLAISRVKAKGKLPEQAIIPMPAALLLLRLMKGDISITYQGKENNRVLAFRQNGLSLMTRLVYGTYPNYEQLVPKGGKALTVSTGGLRDALKTVAAVKPEWDTVTLQTRGKYLVVSACQDDGNNTEVTVPAKGQAKIAFNIQYLTDLLAVLPGDAVTLRMTTPSAPAMVKNNGTTHVLMPKMLNVK